MKIGDYKLDNLKSYLIDSLREDENRNEILEVEINTNNKEITNKQNVADFNNRKVTPENINSIILICDYFNIDYNQTLEFIIQNSDPSKKYKLNKYHKQHYTLPNFMSVKNIICDMYIDEVVKHNAMNYIKYYKNNGINLNSICKYAAKYGRLECLKYAHENGCLWNEGKHAYIDENSYLECFICPYKNYCTWDKLTCHDAARNGHLECLKYAHENGCPWDKWICHDAARNGHLECLKYAHENGCPWDKCTCMYAAFHGNLECLKYAHENGCPWDKCTCMYAAKNGHLECLKYAYENGCRWNSWTCENAAENGHLECLKYAHKNGCYLTINTYYYAKKHTKCFKYLKNKKLIFKIIAMLDGY